MVMGLLPAGSKAFFLVHAVQARLIYEEDSWSSSETRKQTIVQLISTNWNEVETSRLGKRKEISGQDI